MRVIIEYAFVAVVVIPLIVLLTLLLVVLASVQWIVHKLHDVLGSMGMDVVQWSAALIDYAHRVVHTYRGDDCNGDH